VRNILGPGLIVLLVALVVLVAILKLGWGCHAPPEYRRIYFLPYEQGRDEFKKLPIDKQVDMCGYATYCLEPPSGQYACVLASEGDMAVPYLLAQLEAEHTKFPKLLYLNVFLTMHRQYYNLQSEPGLLERLKRGIAAISSKNERADAEEILRKIEADPGVEAQRVPSPSPDSCF